MASLTVFRPIYNIRTWAIPSHSSRSTCTWTSACNPSANVHFCLNSGYSCDRAAPRVSEVFSRRPSASYTGDARDSGTEPAEFGKHSRGRVRRASTHKKQIKQRSQSLVIRRTIHCPPLGDPQPSSEETLLEEDPDIGDDLGEDEVGRPPKSMRLLSLNLQIRPHSIPPLSHPQKLQ